MRAFTSFEEENLRFLVNHHIDFTLVQLTATGLKKSIMDATAPMRTFFVEQGIHNYEHQAQGQEHKLYKGTFILTESDSKETTTSFYRPNTKKGDPRLWIAGLKTYSSPDDIHAIWSLNHQLYVCNITRCNISRAFYTDKPSLLKELILEVSGIFYTDKPSLLKELILEVSGIKNQVSKELLEFFQSKAGEWYPTELNADTAIGRSVETMLGIPQNPLPIPDYKGIEIKSHREKRSSNKNVLFSQAPNWDLSHLKSSREIVELYGYYRNGHKTYHNTVECHKPNSQHLGLELELVKEWLELKHYGKKIDDVAVWTLMKLHERLTEKHHETFWVEAENIMRDGKEYFRYKSIEHTRNPNVHQFDILLDQGLITLDLLLCRGGKGGDTYSFKIKKQGMPLLFPESIVYQLQA